MVQKSKTIYNEAQAKSNDISLGLDSLFEDEGAEFDKEELETFTYAVSDTFMETELLLKPIFEKNSGSKTVSNASISGQSEAS